MATITMDASEYEALKKNISLLEEAKKKEAELSDEIKQLQQEKIQALKDAQHNVTIIKRSVKNELIYRRRSYKDIVSLLRNYFTFKEDSRSLVTYGHYEDPELDHIINICFEKSQTRDLVEDETITTRGFDEVKEEIKKDYIEKLSEQTKADLEKLIALESEHVKLLKSNKKIEDDNFRILSELRTYKEKAFNYEQKFTGLRTEIEKIVQSKWNMFNYLDNLQKLKQKL